MFAPINEKPRLNIYFLVSAKPGSQLYQFILLLLEDAKMRKDITWVDRHNGIFRILNKEKIAQMWGQSRNRETSYDSLSRGLRHYYQLGMLNSVSKKLHYQFTKKALKEWDLIRNQDSIG